MLLNIIIEHGGRKVKQIIEAIFGLYVPVTYIEYLPDGTPYSVIPDGLGGVDWSYVLGVLGFFVVLYCVLRILGAVISKC